jgi:hypothetical protein
MEAIHAVEQEIKLLQSKVRWGINPYTDHYKSCF